MCEYSQSYKRFKKLYKKLGGLYVLETALGKRGVSSIHDKHNKEILLTYYDEDNSVLFSIKSTKKSLDILESKIPSKAIFDALYELECILFSKIHVTNGLSMEFAHMWGWWY